MVAEAPELVRLMGSVAKTLCRGRGALGIAADRATAKAAGGHGLAIAAPRDRPVAEFAGREVVAI